MASPEFSGFSVSQHDWSLHRQGREDQARHEEKIKESVRNNLGNIVSSGDIIIPHPETGKVLKVPMEGIEEYRFRFDLDDPDWTEVGQGNGKSKVGDMFSTMPAPGQEGEGGLVPGTDIYEPEISYEEFEKIAFEGWHLPFMRDVPQRVTEDVTIRFRDIRKSGALANLDKRRSVRENIKRNAIAGDPHFKDLRRDDLRFRTWDKEETRTTNAVVIAMMDVSGSMSEERLLAAKTFFNISRRFLQTQYPDVETVYIAHDTAAKEVGEEKFFTRSENGGTRISSAYALANTIIDERFNPEGWNIYPMHVTDGDNEFKDNNHALRAFKRIHDRANMFAYVQIGQQFSHMFPRSRRFLGILERSADKKLITQAMQGSAEAYDAAKYIFTLDEE
jgi:sporulation protein YhbH